VQDASHVPANDWATQLTPDWNGTCVPKRPVVAHPNVTMRHGNDNRPPCQSALDVKHSTCRMLSPQLTGSLRARSLTVIFPTHASVTRSRVAVTAQSGRPTPEEYEHPHNQSKAGQQQKNEYSYPPND
jgi:hypothetical protein